MFNNLKNRKLFLVLVIVVCIISLFLRIERIGSTEYVDEKIYVKLARFLANGYLASSSSLLDVYIKHGTLLSWANEIEIVAPWFDHPPFFAILDIPFWILGFPRLLPIFLGALSTFLIMYLLRKNRVESLLAGIVFAFYPFAVQLNSMMLLDNGSSFFFLATLALTSKYDKDKSEFLLAFAGVSAGISFLCKEIGVCSILFLFLYLVFSRKSIGRLESLKALIISVGIGSIWFIVGLLLNHELFIDIIATQIQRSSLSQNGYQTLLNTAVKDFSYNTEEFIMGNVSFVLLFSWICSGIFMFNRGHKVVKIGFLSFLLTLIVFKYAWFFTWIGIYPFFSIAVAHVIYTIVQKVSFRKVFIASNGYTENIESC